MYIIHDVFSYLDGIGHSQCDQIHARTGVHVPSTQHQDTDHIPCESEQTHHRVTEQPSDEASLHVKVLVGLELGFMRARRGGGGQPKPQTQPEGGVTVTATLTAVLEQQVGQVVQSRGRCVIVHYRVRHRFISLISLSRNVWSKNGFESFHALFYNIFG